MKYKQISLDNYNIHLIKTKAFKTIDIRVVFREVIRKEDITRRNFLFDMLVSSTGKHKTRRELNIRCQELYSLYLNSSTFRLGNYLISKIGVSFLNPKYTEEGMLDESVALLKEVIFNPNVVGKKFDSKSFKIIRTSLKAEMDTVKEQPRLYANVRMLECLDKDKPYSYHGYCYEEDLLKTNESNLYEYYQELMQNSAIDIFAVGDFNFNDMEMIIRKNFNFQNKSLFNEPLIIKHKEDAKEIRKVIESGDYKQSKLTIGCKIRDLTLFEEKYVSNVYNMLLGGLSDSLLMKNVRADASLAYYISSFINKADSLIIINSGIDGNNFERVLNIILKTLEDIRKGNFDEDTIIKCQTEYISSLDIAELAPGSLLDLHLSRVLFVNEDLEMRKKKILTVTKKDVIDFSQKVLVDTVYLLKGE